MDWKGLSAALRPVQHSMKSQCIMAFWKMNFLVSVILPERLFPSVAALRFRLFVLISKHIVSICHCAKVAFHPQLGLLCFLMHKYERECGHAPAAAEIHELGMCSVLPTDFVPVLKRDGFVCPVLHYAYKIRISKPAF